MNNCVNYDFIYFFLKTCCVFSRLPPACFFSKAYLFTKNADAFTFCDHHDCFSVFRRMGNKHKHLGTARPNLWAPSGHLGERILQSHRGSLLRFEIHSLAFGMTSCDRWPAIPWEGYSWGSFVARGFVVCWVWETSKNHQET